MKTIEIVCQHCGKKHTVVTTQFETLHLNGMPNMSMTDFTKAMVICECGLLVMSRTWYGINVSETMNSAEYQECLNKEYTSEVEKKLALLNALYHFPQMSMYYAYYYDEIGDVDKRNDALRRMIDNIIEEKDTTPYILNGMPMLSLPHSIDLVLYPDARLVDLYRCTGQFDKALSQIKVLSKKYKNITYLKTYLKIEKELIQDKQSQFA